MPTEELEQELRRVFAKAAAGHQHPELARQRLLQHNYRPGSSAGRIAAGLTAVTATGAVVLVLGLSGALGSAPARETGVPGSAPARGTGVPGSTPARETGTIRTAAFTLSRSASGTVTLTISPRVLLDPRTLQNDLAKYGIPAKVTAGSFCSTDPAPAGLSQVVTSSPAASGGSSRIITINPSAMPAGTELSFGSFQLATGQETVFTLIDTGSYACTSTPPTAGSGNSAVVHGGTAGK